MSDGPQRHRHGVYKNLFDVIGGLAVGAAAVLLLRGLARRREAPAPAGKAALPAPSGKGA